MFPGRDSHVDQFCTDFTWSANGSLYLTSHALFEIIEFIVHAGAVPSDHLFQEHLTNFCWIKADVTLHRKKDDLIEHQCSRAEAALEFSLVSLKS